MPFDTTIVLETMGGPFRLQAVGRGGNMCELLHLRAVGRGRKKGEEKGSVCFTAGLFCPAGGSRPGSAGSEEGSQWPHGGTFWPQRG